MKRTLTGHEELNSLDEAELITRIQNGDTEAFTPIVHRYREKIYRLIYRWVHHHETAEDLCQEVFLKAWRALPKFRRTFGMAQFLTAQSQFHSSKQYSERVKNEKEFRKW